MDEARQRRKARYLRAVEGLSPGGLLGPVSQGHRWFGFTREGDDLRVREWAPHARALALIGDFNFWNPDDSPLIKGDDGVWSLFLPGGARLHGGRVKLRVVGADGSVRDRIPAYARRVVQGDDGDFAAEVWLPAPFEWQNPVPEKEAGLKIYEAHVGMAREDGGVGTFAEFERDVLPRVARLGYDALQLMAVQEHPYYGSFGYHVSSPFAVSSRFGTPEDLQRLIDAAHGLGIRVFLDLVHSHAVKNLNEGLDRLDGSDGLYFRGVHPAWDSMLWDVARPEIRGYLLSNVRFWIEEIGFDGLRFDGVTSMVYRDHGLGRTFRMEDYDGPNVDDDAVLYLQLANDLVHALRPDATTIAEDVSGMPGMARPIDEGGLGFDYRLAMGVPDLWIKTLKERRDEEWDLGHLWHALLDRRRDEKHVGYAESHDQSLVGDQTIAFRLMGAAMYDDMARERFPPEIDRGLALHKIVRLLTFALAGEAWLNFMGNEFGHPEWVDFPREGNGWSGHHARRQWSLVDSPFLHYRSLETFDAALMGLDRDYGLLARDDIERLLLDEGDRLLAFRRGPLLFAVNLHPTASYDGLRLPAPDRADYRTVLSTDEEPFSGHARAIAAAAFPIQNVPVGAYAQSVQVYLPSRTALVLSPEGLGCHG